MKPMKLHLDELRKICKIVLDHYEDLGYEYLPLDCDYYWDVSSSDRYESYTKPSELDIGQLSDDWSELTALLKNPDSVITYHSVWLGAILQAIGQNIPERANNNKASRKGRNCENDEDTT